jgi:hypothetical protein
MYGVIAPIPHPVDPGPIRPMYGVIFPLPTNRVDG